MAELKIVTMVNFRADGVELKFNSALKAVLHLLCHRSSAINYLGYLVHTELIKTAFFHFFLKLKYFSFSNVEPMI